MMHPYNWKYLVWHYTHVCTHTPLTHTLEVGDGNILRKTRRELQTRNKKTQKNKTDKKNNERKCEKMMKGKRKKLGNS